MITDEFKKRCDTPSDINEHLVALSELSKECNHITEMGVRYIVSTWAFLEGLKGRKGKLVSIDIEPPSRFGANLFEVIDMAEAEGIDFEFRLADTLAIEIEETDLLFIDTLHTGEQLKQELKLHGDKAKKYIAFHDTMSCRDELWHVIEDFIAEGKWKIKVEYKHNNGVTVLERC